MKRAFENYQIQCLSAVRCLIGALFNMAFEHCPLQNFLILSCSGKNMATMGNSWFFLAEATPLKLQGHKICHLVQI